MTTPILGIAELAQNQSQPHVTINEALRTLEVVCQLRVLDKDLATPPASPGTTARYIVAAGATGAWLNQAGKIAFILSGSWEFLTPESGWLAYVVDEATHYRFDGAAWVEFTAGGGGGSSYLGSPLLSIAGPGSPTTLIPAVTEIEFANATVTDLGGGSVLVTPSSSSSGGSSGAVDPALEWSEYDDLIVDDLVGGYDGDVSSTASITWDNAIAGRPGVVQMSTNAATAASAGITKGARTLATQKTKLRATGGVLTFECVARMTSLVAGGETGFARVGFMDEISGAPTNAIHLQYEGTGNWILYCRDGSSSTADTGVAVDLNWHHFKIEVNSGGTSVQAYIDGVAVGSPVTGNIPTAGFTWGANVQKTAGTTPVTLQVDLFKVGQVFSAARY